MNEHVQAVVNLIETKLAALSDLKERLIKWETEMTDLAKGTGTVKFADPRTLVQSTGRGKKEKRPYQKRRGKEKRPEIAESGAHGVTRPTTVAGKAVSTVAGGMKSVIAAFDGKGFTAAQVEAEMERRHGEEDFWKQRSGSGPSGNLSYWTKTGKLEKTADGYRALDREFFSKVEF